MDHIEAIAERSRHPVRVRSGIGGLPADLDLDRFDAIVIHYSLFVADPRHVPHGMAERIARSRAAKLLFLHDEHENVLGRRGAIRRLGVGTILTCMPEREWPRLYPEAELGPLRLRRVRTGYVSPRLQALNVAPNASRPIDIAYRGRVYPSWHGPLAAERLEIAERAEAAAGRHGWRTDISVRERDRIYGKAWLEHLARSRCVLATESGADRVAFGSGNEPVTEPIAMRQVSPRIFEAAATRTLIAGFEGEWSALLEDGETFVAIRRDDHALDGLAAVLADQEHVSRIVERAHKNLIASGDNADRHLAAILDEEIDLALTGRVRIGEGYAPQEFEQRFGDYRSPWRVHLLKDRAADVAKRAFAHSTDVLPEAAGARLERMARRGRTILRRATPPPR